MSSTDRTRRFVLIAALLVAAVAFIAPASASAGAYTVDGACADWELDKQPAVDADSTGCNFALANSVQPGAPPAAGGNTSRWLYNAPPGARLAGASLVGSLFGGSGWQARALVAGGDGSVDVMGECPGSACGPNRLLQSDGTPNSTQLVLQVRCTGTSCPRDQRYGQTGTFPSTVDVTIEDFSTPGVTVTGGSLFDGWRSGIASFTYDAGDNVGIQRTAPVVDGSPQTQEPRGCDPSRKVPCPNGGGRFELDTRRFGDGSHSIRVEATDTASNRGVSTDRRALIDNTAPAAALDLAVVGGEGWRRENDFSITWVAPKQDAAPVDALVYRFCPEGTPAEKTDGCTDPQTETRLEPVDKDDPSKGTRVEGLKVPKAGGYQARFTLRDAAGNFAEKTAVARTLRFDPDPPSLVFLGQDPADPARLRVRASDATSGLARSEIEVQREGEPVWRPLPTEPTGDGFSAFLDDEALPFGGYVVRARTVDQAGNEASTNLREDGAVAQLKLPIRLVSNLQVGARGKRRCTGRGKQGTCRYRLRSRVGVSYRGTKRLYGRLRVGQEPLRGTPVEVWRQTKLPGAPLERIDTVTTSKTGRFQVKATKGPARLLRFRYAGTPQVRGIQGDVRMQVRGTTTFKPGRSRVLNGDYVTLRGRVQGGPLPATGKLVELQVHTRRQWRTFAQPRTNAAGRWEYRYRFEQIRRSVRFRFRARLRAEPGYPYETGTSRTRRILVKGR